ncbi:MAG: hypothetical protein PVI80_11680 [Anaerolineae bacterium]|jgi:hypothetical protein
MATSNVEKMRQYMYRQYEVEEGSVADNIYALFAEDAVIYRGEDVLSTKDLVQTATLVRETPKSERIMEYSNISEDGDTMTFTMRVRFRNPETGELAETESDNWVRFNGQGKVIESRAMPKGGTEAFSRLSNAGKQ